MKKLKFNSTLNHKQNDYKTYEVEVEKIIPLYGREFEDMKNNMLSDNYQIIENRDLMHSDENVAHCLLFVDSKSGDGILVEAEGYGYANKSSFIPNAAAIIEQSKFTAGERQIHQELKKIANRITELAHTGQHTFSFEDMLGNDNIRSMMIQAVAEMLSRRNDIAEVHNHYLEIAGHHDFTVTTKPIYDMKLYCPLEIKAEPEIYESDWEESYEEDYEIIPSVCARRYAEEINHEIEKYAEPEEKNRGLMIYYNEQSVVNEKIFSAIPSVEVKNGELMGVLNCKLTDVLTDTEMKEFQDWWTGQASDGWGEGFEQRGIKTDDYGEIYVSFWNCTDDWSIKTEEEINFNQSETFEMDISI